ncbi:HAD family hydrolase [Thermogemmatispora tikiterensis]|uniref:HAD family hydrolase n=1 Tax=Thermogemmatispora tikiterensis TaxID=1825093 RepID=UPI001676400D|nr:HAD family hydrolase [Thermogemmatispora tikiterensis]
MRLLLVKGRIIRCVLFDLGDTLWYRKDQETWRRLEFAANCQAIALLRMHLESCSLPDQDDVTLGRSLRVAFDAQTRARIRRDPSHEPDGAEIAMETLAQLGWGQIDRQLGAALFEALRVRIIDSRLLYDDALSTLAELRRRGFLLGVVTNRLWGGPPFQEDLRAFGLFEYFDPATIAISADLGVRKPDPAIFLHTLRALNVSPTEAAMVGDSLRSDIVGAKRLGLLAIWKPKPRVREALQARLVAPGATSANASFGHQEAFAPPSAVSAASDLPPDLPPGLHVTDDDYVLSTVQGPGSDPLALLASNLEEYKPDLMIEHLSELLEIFPKAGVL